MRAIFNRAELVEAGWELNDSKWGVIASHNIFSPVKTTMLLADNGHQLIFESDADNLDAPSLELLRDALLVTNTPALLTA